MPRRDKRDVRETPQRKGFYEAALTEAERMRLPAAREVDGIDEEIAMLRVKLYTAVEKYPAQLGLLAKGVSMLVRMVAVRYRMSEKSQEDLSESLAGVVEGISTALGLGEFSDYVEG